jgi:hypothetical protein
VLELRAESAEEKTWHTHDAWSMVSYRHSRRSILQAFRIREEASDYERIYHDTRHVIVP